jgi:hypothetical protein
MSHNTDKIKPDHVAGYRGIMALDLDAIPTQFQKNAIERHIKDIEEYNRDQLKRPEQMRYENTVARIERTHRMDKAVLQKRQSDAMEAQTIRDNQMSSERRKYDERERHIQQILTVLALEQHTPTTDKKLT